MHFVSAAIFALLLVGGLLVLADCANHTLPEQHRDFVCVDETNHITHADHFKECFQVQWQRAD